MDFNFFNKLVPYTCLIDELQYRIFGVYVPEKKGKEL